MNKNKSPGEIGERIKKLVDASGMTRVEFAEKVRVSKQTLYKYEQGIIKNIPYDTVLRIAEIGGISPAELIGWDSPSAKDSKTQSINRFHEIMSALSNLGYNTSREVITINPIVDDWDRVTVKLDNEPFGIYDFVKHTFID